MKKNETKSTSNFIMVELFFSLLIAIILIGIILNVCIYIKNNSENANKVSEANLIMTNIIENMNSKTFDELDTYIEELSGVGIEKSITENLQKINVIGEENNSKFFGAEIPSGYEINVEIRNEANSFNIIKNVGIFIYYEINGKVEVLEMSTILKRENIDECNVPNLSYKYFLNSGVDTEEYNIIPIKYSYDLKSYVKTTETDDEWYNYSAKEWAKVLVFSKEGYDLEGMFIDENGIVNKTANYNEFVLKLEDYIYTWIPNFSIKDDQSYFRYGVGKKAIIMDFLYVDEKYLYLNTVSEEIPDISNECSFTGVTGVWAKITDLENEYYKNFSKTKYAPLNLHF